MKKLANLLPFGPLFILPLLFYPGVSASSWRSTSDVHAVIEFASSLLAMTAGIMVLLHFFTTGRRFFLIIAIGFVLIGAEEFVHALFSFDRIWLETPPAFKLAISSTWLAGNFVLAASFILALSFGKGEVLPANRGRTAVAGSIVGLICAASVTWLIFHAPRLPHFVVLGSTSKQLIELSLSLLFFGAFLFHSRAYLKQPSRSPLLWSIIACIIFRVLVHLFVFDARAFYDSRWDAAHLLVFLGYFFPIFGVWGETIKLNQSVQAQVIELGKAITERSRAEELLRISQENLLLATEGAKLGVWNWNIVTDELIWSDRCKALFGIRPDEAMSYQRFRDALHPDDREKADKVIKEALDNHKDYDIEYRSLWPDGSIHWLEAKGRGYYDATGRATRMEGVVFDIAGRKQAEAARSRLNAQLQAKNQELEQVVYVASHDLRSPLVNIDGYGREVGYAVDALNRALAADSTTIEALKAAARPPVQEMTTALRYIHNSAAQMDALLTGLLKLSRFGRSALTIVPLNMNELVSKVVAGARFQLDESGVALDVAELPSCWGDAVQVGQVFTNLLSNALKYLDPARPGVIRIGGNLDGQRAVFWVEDNGIGIAPAHQENIFEIFHRLDPAKSQGEGLGLSIVRQAVGRLAGEVRVESRPGGGSRFYVVLPAART